MPSLLPVGEGGPKGRMRVGRWARSQHPTLTLSRKDDGYRRRALKPSPNGRGARIAGRIFIRVASA